MAKRSWSSLMRDAMKAAPGGLSNMRQTLSDRYGPGGELFSYLASLFAGGGRPNLRDMQNTQRVMKDASYDVDRPDSVTMIPLGDYYRANWERAGGKLAVNPLPPPKSTQSPPLETNLPSLGQTPPATAARGSSRSIYVPSAARVPNAGSRRPEGLRGNPYAGPMMTNAIEAPDPFSQEIETPESSNVFSIAYDDETGILYVTFKAPSKYDPDDTKTDTNICNGKPSRFANRPHVRGPMYWYGSKGKPVPRALYEEFISASSKGQFVWDKLRICGQMYGSQYAYGLMQPAVVGTSLYVPRRATHRGFRVRAVPTVGRGKRSYRISTLPEQLF